MRIGLIADSHIPHVTSRLHPGVHRAFEGVEMILHAGDLTGPEVLEVLGQIAPVHAVRGDQDIGLDHLPLRQVIEVEGKRIGLIHGNRPRWLEMPGTTWNMFFGQRLFLAPRFYANVCRQFEQDQVDCVVCGHIHRPYIGDVKGVLVINPGSTYLNILDRKTQPGQYVSVGMLEIIDDSLRATIVPLPEAWQDFGKAQFGDAQPPPGISSR
ncbi:MAG: metallophosphoesterase family protein [Chloroflexota bacterium]|nr:metallophosphoesterase family protein [Chloroflexota bacterium]